MLNMIVAVLGGAVDAGDAAVGAWGNISFNDNVGGSRTTASTITFTSGGSRTIGVAHTIVTGNLQYKIGSGSYIDCPSGTQFAVTTGQTVTFQYTCFYESESGTATITDDTLVATIDTFTYAFNYTGPPL